MKAAIFIFLLIGSGFTFIEQDPETKTSAVYELVWSDEFRGDGKLDPKKWGYEYGFVRNFEKQYYTDRPENVRIENGKLVIESRIEKLKNKDFKSVNHKNWRNKRKFSKYTSASVTTKGFGEWKYGKIEVRARLAKGVGAWSAIWMLGENLEEVGWVKSGEIDIMENVGFDPNFVLGTIHTEAYNYENENPRSGKIEIADPHSKYHDYAIEWTPKKIDFMVDEKVYYTFKNENKTSSEWAFDQKFHLKINNAIGGTWGGRKGIDDSSFPQKMYIDFVRVYQKAN